MKYFRFLIVAAAMAFTWFFLSARKAGVAASTHRPFAQLSLEVGPWHGREVPLPDDILHILGDGDFSERIFQDGSDRPHIDLFLGYVADQRLGSMLHSPKLCLPGAGWAALDEDMVNLQVGRPEPLLTNRYLVQRAADRQVVLYWYIANHRLVTDEYRAVFYRSIDGFRFSRSEAALIRVATPLQSSESIDQATARAQLFIRQLLPLLHDFVPE